jgi:hypothetical protein
MMRLQSHDLADTAERPIPSPPANESDPSVSLSLP